MLKIKSIEEPSSLDDGLHILATHFRSLSKSRDHRKRHLVPPSK